MQNANFRAWAHSMGYVVKKQPEALQGDGDVWGVPLKKHRGWLYDGGPGMIGVDLRGTSKLVNACAKKLSQVRGWRLQVVAMDAVAGRILAADFYPDLEAILDPKRSPRRSPRKPKS